MVRSRRAAIAVLTGFVMCLVWVLGASPASANAGPVCNRTTIYGEVTVTCFGIYNTGGANNYVGIFVAGDQGQLQSHYFGPGSATNCYARAHVWGPKGSPSWASPLYTCAYWKNTMFGATYFTVNAKVPVGLYCEAIDYYQNNMTNHQHTTYICFTISA